MASNWIRVDAAIGDDKGLAKARRILGVSRPAMVGMQVLLEAELLAHHPSGIVAEIDPETLAEWAGFASGGDQLSTQEMVKFSTALAQLTDSNGRLVGWEERHSVLLHRMERDAERKRLTREAQRLAREEAEKQRAESEGRPKDGVKTSSRRPNATERNGTVRNEQQQQSGSFQERPRASTADRVEAFEAAVSTPRRSLKEILQPLSKDVFAFWRTHYDHKGVSEERKLDTAEQLRALHDGQLIGDDAGGSVQAYTRERLDAKCRDVNATALRDPDTAIVVLFRKLADTSDVAGALVTRERAPLAAADQISHDRRAVVATWAEDHPREASAIRAELRTQFPGDDAYTAESREWAFVSQVLQHVTVHTP